MDIDKQIEIYLYRITHVYWNEYITGIEPFFYTYLKDDEIHEVTDRLDRENIEYRYTNHDSHIEISIMSKDIILHIRNNKIDLILKNG